MVNKNIDAIHKFLTKNKLIVIIIIVLGIVGTIYSFWPKRDIIDNNAIMIQNSTLTNSPIFQKSSNISLTYNSPPDSDLYSPFYSQSIFYKNTNSLGGKNYNLYFLKFILPDDQEAFLDKVLFNTTYQVASCNDEKTDCYIYHKYRKGVEIKEEDICWIFTTRIGRDEIGSDKLIVGERFSKHPEECSIRATEG